MKGQRQSRSRQEREAFAHLEGASAGNEAAVLDRVLHGPQAVTEGVLHLCDGVVRGALEEDGAGARVLHVLNKGVLLLAKDVLVDLSRVSEALWRQLLQAANTDEQTRLRFVSWEARATKADRLW